MDEAPAYRKKTPRWAIIGLFGLVAVAVLLLINMQRPARVTAPSPTKPTKALADPIVRPSLVTTGLQAPTAIIATHQALDKRLFVVELAGTIRIITGSEQLTARPYLDISQKVLAGGEMGLLGLAFHSDYAKNGYFYINYVDKEQNTVLARYKVSADANVADSDSEKILFRLKQPYTNHNGGDLAFGPDGYLYAALGDGGSGGDPENRAQDKNSYFGKILRLDINKGDPYGIPPTNPFVGQANAKPEIWAYGLRNPWRISFDKVKGDLFIADVGQGKLEELNLQLAASKGGENYGWRCFEGNQSFKADGCLEANKYVAPILEYNHDEDRCSITGGYIYRGRQSPALVDKYFYGDYCNGQIFYASQKQGRWQQTLVAETPFKISTFGQGSDGELYLADYATGSLYRIQDTAN